MADVIKEFLVGLGFKVDQQGLNNFSKGIDKATKFAKKLALEIIATEAAVAAAIIKMASSFDDLYWQTQRLGSSANDIRGFGYAISQLGGSAKGAQASLENLAEFGRSSPGAANYLERLGVSPKDIGNAVATAKDLERTFASMPYYRAKAYAGPLGIDPITMQAMMRDTGKFEAQQKAAADKIGKIFGVNFGDMTDPSNKFMTQLRGMKMEMGMVFDALTFRALEWLLPRLDQFSTWISDVLPKLEQFGKWVTDLASGKKLEGIGAHLGDIVDDARALTKALNDLAASPAIQKFGDALAEAVDHALKSLTHLVRMVNFVLSGNWSGAGKEAQAFANEGAHAVASAAFGGAGVVNGIVGDPVGVASGNTRQNANAAFGYFKSRGMDDATAQGVTAMLFAESHLNPNSVNPTSGARGIGQWLGDRAKLFARLFHHGLERSTLGEQLQFLTYEFDHGEHGAWTKILGAKGAWDKASAGIRNFERPGTLGALGDESRAGIFLNSDPFSARLGVGGKGNVNINQKTEINVGGGDAHKTAAAVADHQNSVNQRLVSNASVFAY